MDGVAAHPLLLRRRALSARVPSWPRVVADADVDAYCFLAREWIEARGLYCGLGCGVRSCCSSRTAESCCCLQRECLLLLWLFVVGARARASVRAILPNECHRSNVREHTRLASVTVSTTAGFGASHWKQATRRAKFMVRHCRRW